jgi:hypothetical protein
MKDPNIQLWNYCQSDDSVRDIIKKWKFPGNQDCKDYLELIGKHKYEYMIPDQKYIYIGTMSVTIGAID